MSRVLVCALAASAFAASFACAEPVGQRPYYAVAPTPRAPAPGYQQPPPYARHQAAAPAPQPRYAATRGHLGGGFIEAIFGGSGEGYANPYGAQRAAPTEAETSRYAADPRYQRQVVSYAGPESPGTVVVDTRHFLLYLVQDGGKAIRYGVGVGRPGFTWSGVHEVSNKREWPDWRPPDEMLRRAPNLPHFMAGGPENPLGARALYLGSTLYRIHGSNEPWTIGTQVSSGCIRMRNDDVIDLYDRVKLGTKVVVI